MIFVRGVIVREHGVENVSLEAFLGLITSPGGASEAGPQSEPALRVQCHTPAIRQRYELGDKEALLTTIRNAGRVQVAQGANPHDDTWLDRPAVGSRAGRIEVRRPIVLVTRGYLPTSYPAGTPVFDPAAGR